MLPFADGSDLGASLRNPAKLQRRRVAADTWSRSGVADTDLWNNLSVHGPIARTAADAALLLYGQAGGDRRVPNAIWEDPSLFLKSLDRRFNGAKIAYSPTLGGAPVEHAVRDTIEAGLRHFAALGCTIEEAEPDLSEADACFDVLRAFSLSQTYGPPLDKHRAQLKDTAIWNFERGAALTGAQVIEAFRQHSRIYERMCRFMERYDFLLAPCNQVLPFPVDQPYVTEINGEKLDSYIDWMKTCFRITVTAHPALSVPIGFAANKLPVGIQIVGRYRDEWGILQLAHALEQQLPLWRETPPVCAIA